ncbi:MAG: hypothetical protein QGH21_02365, partial [Candidatus Poseidoniia archaeon]|nr:hypothetical protein [Candidatus Poseidoniia archaeon]
MSGIAGPSELPAEARFLVEVNEVTCKGCAICVSVCSTSTIVATGRERAARNRVSPPEFLI